ncbi:methionine aminopeptidase [Acrocarpospora phusangensis]|uniref:Methionine aminopeptidase n=1 Tax=Acrocarpospora phusangensis TaxID=1070424 RepID=A0A919QCU9_9ACTN|nr:type I methionyl aminopeptidase [Acrocarpospora phusangensis]GIH25093.1 methionine aminopeptidase [Acrocarpospora phusangensis]
MVEIKTSGELDAMREAGRVVGRALAAMKDAVAPGVRLTELNEIAATILKESKATSAFLNYQPAFAPTPFPAVICASVNDVIVHGIPDRYQVRDGDLLTIDFGAYLDGWAGDAAFSTIVGTGSAEDLRMIDVAGEALEAAIKAAVPGNRLGDVEHAVGQVGRAAGYGIMDDFGGHGIGRHMHEPPFVRNEGRPGRGLVLRPGLTLAIEPMFVSGGSGSYYAAADGWGLRSSDGTRAVHVEHTVAITDDGPRILTLP